MIYEKHARVGKEPSKLCWADKLSIKYNPWWIYVPLAMLTGEIHEYRQNAARSGFIPLTESHRVWFKWVKEWLKKQGYEQKSSVKLF